MSHILYHMSNVICQNVNMSYIINIYIYLYVLYFRCHNVIYHLCRYFKTDSYLVSDRWIKNSFFVLKWQESGLEVPSLVAKELQMSTSLERADRRVGSWYSANETDRLFILGGAIVSMFQDPCSSRCRQSFTCLHLAHGTLSVSRWTEALWGITASRHRAICCYLNYLLEWAR